MCRGGWEQPRQSQDVPVLPDGASLASELERSTRGTDVYVLSKGEPARTWWIGAGRGAHRNTRLRVRELRGGLKPPIRRPRGRSAAYLWRGRWDTVGLLLRRTKLDPARGPRLLRLRGLVRRRRQRCRAAVAGRRGPAPSRAAPVRRRLLPVRRDRPEGTIRTGVRYKRTLRIVRRRVSAGCATTGRQRSGSPGRSWRSSEPSGAPSMVVPTCRRLGSRLGAAAS